MSKHEAVTTHIFSTEEGIKIVAEIDGGRLRLLSIQFPGSGNRAMPITPAEIAELAAIASEAATFLTPPSIHLG